MAGDIMKRLFHSSLVQNRSCNSSVLGFQHYMIILFPLLTLLLSCSTHNLNVSEKRTRPCEKLDSPLYCPLDPGKTMEYPNCFYYSARYFRQDIINQWANSDACITNIRARYSSLSKEDAIKESRLCKNELNGAAKILEGYRAELGECFDSGEKSELARANYTKMSAMIEGYKKKIEGEQQQLLDIIEKREREKLSLKLWRESNREYLAYEDNEVRVEISDITLSAPPVIDPENFYYGYTKIKLSVFNKDNERILKPVNVKVLSYVDDDSREKTFSRPTGMHMMDSFKNEYKIESFKPEFYSGFGYGIKPGSEQRFDVVFRDTPLNMTKDVLLKFDSGTFGQKREITLKIPNRVFFQKE